MVCAAWRRALYSEPFPRLSLAANQGMLEWVVARRPALFHLDLNEWEHGSLLLDEPPNRATLRLQKLRALLAEALHSIQGEVGYDF